MNNKKVFSVQLFIHNFLQLKLVGILGTIIIAALTTYTIIEEGVSQAKVCADYGYEIGSYTCGITGGDLSALMLSFVVVTPVLMLMAFNFNNKRSSSDFYNALPFTRLNLYLTNIAAVFAWILIIFAVSSLGITAAIISYKNYFVYSAGELALFIFGMFLSCVVCAASIAIACALTGNLISNICLSGLIMFLPVTLRAMISSLVEMMFAFSSDIQVVPLIGDEKNLVGSFAYYCFERNTSFTGIFTDGGSLVFSICLSLIYFAIGYVCYAKRKSEIAGKASVGNRIQACIRVIIGFVVAEIVGMLIVDGTDGSDILAVIIIFVLGYIAVLVYELLTGDKRDLLKKSAFSYIIACVAAMVFTGAVALGANAMKSYVADADQISYVTIESKTSYYTNDYFGDEINKLKISDKDVIKIIADAYNKEINAGSVRQLYYSSSDEDESFTSMNVYMKDGLIGKRRKLYISLSDYQKLLTELGEVSEYQQIYTNLPDSSGASFYFNNQVMMGQDNAKKLYETLKAEVGTVDFASYVSSFNNSYACDSIYVSFVKDGTSYNISIPFSNVIPKSTAMFMQLANEASAKIDAENISYSDIKKLITDLVETGTLNQIGTRTALDILSIDLDTQEQDYIYSKSVYKGTENTDYEAISDVGYTSTGKTLADAYISITQSFAASTLPNVDPTKPFYQINIRIYIDTDAYTSSGYYYYFYVQ